MNTVIRWIQARFSRRGFLTLVLLGIFHLLVRGIGWTRTSFSRVNAFLVRSIEGRQQVDLRNWHFRVEGLIEKPLVLRFDELQALPKKVMTRDFQCVEGWGLEKQKWEGFHMKEILSRVKVTSEAKFITFHATGGKYKDSLSLQEALEPDTLLAYTLNDKRLPPDNGFPLRLVVPRMYGYKGVKWVERIVFTEQQEIGTWEEDGYSPDGAIPGLTKTSS
jgi:DMSO/TMAO reductase YedYZ molybdopterin-dependent catalytic subunit